MCVGLLNTSNPQEECGLLCSNISGVCNILHKENVTLETINTFKGYFMIEHDTDIFIKRKIK